MYLAWFTILCYLITYTIVYSISLSLCDVPENKRRQVLVSTHPPHVLPSKSKITKLHIKQDQVDFAEFLRSNPKSTQMIIHMYMFLAVSVNHHIPSRQLQPCGSRSCMAPESNNTKAHSLWGCKEPRTQAGATSKSLRLGHHRSTFSWASFIMSDAGCSPSCQHDSTKDSRSVIILTAMSWLKMF